MQNGNFSPDCEFARQHTQLAEAPGDRTQYRLAGTKLARRIYGINCGQPVDYIPHLPFISQLVIIFKITPWHVAAPDQGLLGAVDDLGLSRAQGDRARQDSLARLSLYWWMEGQA